MDDLSRHVVLNPRNAGFLRVADDPLGAPILGAMGCYRPGIGTIALPNTGRLGRHIRVGSHSQMT